MTMARDVRPVVVNSLNKTKEHFQHAGLRNCPIQTSIPQLQRRKSTFAITVQTACSTHFAIRNPETHRASSSGWRRRYFVMLYLRGGQFAPNRCRRHFEKLGYPQWPKPNAVFAAGQQPLTIP